MFCFMARRRKPTVREMKQQTQEARTFVEAFRLEVQRKAEEWEVESEGLWDILGPFRNGSLDSINGELRIQFANESAGFFSVYSKGRRDDYAINTDGRISNMKNGMMGISLY